MASKCTLTYGPHKSNEQTRKTVTLGPAKVDYMQFYHNSINNCNICQRNKYVHCSSVASDDVIVVQQRQL